MQSRTLFDKYRSKTHVSPSPASMGCDKHIVHDSEMDTIADRNALAADAIQVIRGNINR